MNNNYAVIETEDEIRVECSGTDVVCRMGARREDKSNDDAEREAQLRDATIIVAALNAVDKE